MGKKIITYGSFDIFHFGHLILLKRLKQIGDHLTVGISTDEFNLTKNKKSVVPFSERFAIVSSISFVDDVISEYDWSQKEFDIISRGISVFGMGSDWTGKFDYLKEICEVVYLPRTPYISSTLIKKTLLNENNNIVT